MDKNSPDMQFYVADNNVMSHSRAHLEQMMKDLIEEAERWDLEPNPASLWWTSSFSSEKKMDLTIGAKTGHYRIPFEEFFKIRGFSLNRQGKTQDCLEERMQKPKMLVVDEYLRF